MLRTNGSLLSSSDVGHANRARVIRRLYEDGPLTRADLATSLLVSRATIGTVVQPLIDHGVLVEQGLRTSGVNGGKPSRPLWFGEKRSIGAIYLSSDECEVAVLGLDGRILAQAGESFAGAEHPDVMAILVGLGDRVLGGRDLSGIGVAFAGMVDTPTGDLIANYRRPEVGLLPVAPTLSERFGTPVFVDHHPRIQAYGDAWFGLGRSLDSFASVFTGEVLGVGCVQGGQVMRGVRGAGGEIGHMVVDMRGELCMCGRRGCWETVATLPWLRDEAARLGLASPEGADALALVEGVSAGSAGSRELLEQYADNVALGLANLEQTLGLGTYIVHGDVARGGEVMRELLQARIVEMSPHREPEPRVILAPEPDKSTILGATGLVLSNVFQARL